VTAASNPEVSIPGIAALAERHVGYGVVPDHFVAAKEALFWSFRQHLQDELDGETMRAWSAAFDMIAESMIRVMVNTAGAPALPERDSRVEAETDYESIEDVLFKS
jgi:hemoglobin-like flavoprotein